MTKRWEKRRQLQYALGTVTPCTMQHTGWPCPTCFYGAISRYAVDEDERHAMWDATLVLRGDYHDGECDIEMPDARLTAVVDTLLRVLPKVH